MSWRHHDEPRRQELAGQPAENVLHANQVGTLILQGPAKYDAAILTDEVRLAIAQAWEFMPADKLIENRVVDIAYTLDEVLTDTMGYTNDQRYRIAEELVRYIRLMLEQPTPAPAQAATPPASPAPEGDDAAETAAMAQLLRMAEDDVEIRDNNSPVTQAIGRRVVVSDTNAHVGDIICLVGGVVKDNNARVEIFCPYGVTVRMHDNNAEVKIRHRTNVELLAMARRYDL